MALHLFSLEGYQMVLKPCFQCLSTSVFKHLPCGKRFDLFFPRRCPGNASYEWLGTRDHHDIVQFIGKDLELCTINDYCRA